jgi:hypothetical protein
MRVSSPSQATNSFGNARLKAMGYWALGQETARLIDQRVR